MITSKIENGMLSMNLAGKCSFAVPVYQKESSRNVSSKVIK